jgi:ATP-binding cassette subfamily B protein
MTASHAPKRRFFVPEVVQTSAMDCGPAVLKCLLDGFGIPVSYGRLREACQTDVDGTSIDVIEAVAAQLGLLVEQVMLPVNHLLLAEAEALPAILIVRLPNGLTHFVLAWRRHGPFVQVMDPAVGRRWVPCRRLLREAYVHSQRVPAKAWHCWALSGDFQRPLARRLRNLGLGRGGQALLDRASAVPSWRPLAALDAATRLAEALTRAGGLRRGREARRALWSLVDRTQAEVPGGGGSIPEAYWSVLPASSGPQGQEQVLVRGAVLVRVCGRAAGAAPPADADPAGKPLQLSPELAAARAEADARPLRALLPLLRGEGWSCWTLLAVGLFLAAAGTVLEAVLLRGLLDVGRDLTLVEQRLGAIGFLLLFAGLLLLLEGCVAGGLVRLGRHLETRLRAAFVAKIPRLHDRYFQSRPTSDMAERGHALYQIRLLPQLAGRLARAALTLLVTAAAIAWADPLAAPVALLAAGAAIALPLVFHPVLRELDLRVRTHAGALSRFYLDALVGLAAVRAHGAGRAVRGEHEGLLAEWARASRRLLRWVVGVEGLQTLVGLGLAACLVLGHTNRLSDAAGALLLAYWALNLPVLGQEIALLARQYPTHRNLLLRLLEPLGAPEEESAENGLKRKDREEPAPASRAPLASPPSGVALTFESVTVRAAGHTILEGVQAHLAAGSQVAIVGASGAGKSTLVGLLLGWHHPAAGRILVDGDPLEATRLDRLRQETVWVDPAVRLWNRSLVGNLLYGTRTPGPRGVGEVLHEADLYPVVQRLPDGLQTALGEGGGLLSGGEGQRVRLGRALCRSPVRLVLLDEPFRGLDRARRRDLLRRARQVWQGATLLCITHDIAETRDFERVLVLEAGRVVEDASPQRLSEDLGSRYRALLDAETAVRTGLWTGAAWQRLRLDEGRLTPDQAGEGT